MPKKIQFTVEPIVSVQTGPKFAHIISIPSFYTFQHLNKIRLKKNELQLILCAYDLPQGVSDSWGKSYAYHSKNYKPFLHCKCLKLVVLEMFFI